MCVKILHETNTSSIRTMQNLNNMHIYESNLTMCIPIIWYLLPIANLIHSDGKYENDERQSTNDGNCTKVNEQYDT